MANRGARHEECGRFVGDGGQNGKGIGKVNFSSQELALGGVVFLEQRA